METMAWKGNMLVLLDQQKLPGEVAQQECKNVLAVADAIRSMKVRGAPAIGAAAAFGLALGAMEFSGEDMQHFKQHVAVTKDLLAGTRPTAVNLFWALERMQRRLDSYSGSSVAEAVKLLEQEAMEIHQEDLQLNRSIGEYGNQLVPQRATVLTHCNAGSLATAGYGTALGVIRAAHDSGKEISVYADETRPLLQGARLTVWELMQDKIPVTLITDSMAGYVMQLGKIDLVVVGADRIAANGDVANKIGTYSLAVLARQHDIPFYVAAPYSTVDMQIAHGAEIAIEQRDASEVRRVGGVYTAPEDVPVFNPAFDVTPAQFITAIITDRGVIKPPFNQGLIKMTGGEKNEQDID